MLANFLVKMAHLVKKKNVQVRGEVNFVRPG